MSQALQLHICFCLPPLAPIMSDRSTENLVYLCELNHFVQLLVLKFQKMKQHFQKFLINTITTDEVKAATASIESNEDSQDIHREVLLSIEAEKSTQVQAISNYTPPLSPQQRVSLEQSAEEILSGVKKNVEVQYLVPVIEEPLSETGMHIL